MLNKLKKLIVVTDQEAEDSKAIVDAKVIEKFVSDPNFPYLVSFPRTGSHWLRMLMELYFQKPSLIRVFYMKNSNDFSCYHWHDEDLKLERKSVIYLYRHPVPTIYSQLNYYKEDINDTNRIAYWSELYGRHLSKWLFDEKFTIRKTILTYEALKNRMLDEFNKIAAHLNEPRIDYGRLQNIVGQVSKESLKKKTKHDNQVVNLNAEYEDKRREFENKYTNLVFENVVKQNQNIKSLF